eukprot:UN07166
MFCIILSMHCCHDTIGNDVRLIHNELKWCTRLVNDVLYLLRPSS